MLGEWLLAAAGRFGSEEAVREDGRSVTFAALRGDALRLAAALQQRGVEKGDRVALVLPKSADAIVAVYASLLAGAVYVPIPPRWPAERIEATFADCAPRLVFAEPGAKLPGAVTMQEALASSPIAFRQPAIAPQDPAFILFTSGSTGLPKGVEISHGAVAAFVRWSAEEFHIVPGDRLACPSPLSFDLSTFDIFNMALRGATCVLVPEQTVWIPRFLVRLLIDERITVWYSVPSVLSALLNEGRFEQHAYPHLRAVLFAGEVFAAGDLARLQAALPGAGLYNLYGPTETNVVTWHRVPQGFDPSRPIPIGRACPYARLRVADGELLAGGESLMTGYWNRPDETARALADLPDDNGTERRYYRTGDRVSVDSAGVLTFVGRLDRQVKRRGYRIELGDIEAALHRDPMVVEAAAVASEGPHGTMITGFVRTQEGWHGTPFDTRARCAEVLPAYMLPDRIVFVPALPRGVRGKIDYARLQEEK